MAISSRYGCPAEPFEVVACEASHGSGMTSYSQARSQVGSPKLESCSIPFFVSGALVDIICRPSQLPVRKTKAK